MSNDEMYWAIVMAALSGKGKNECGHYPDAGERQRWKKPGFSASFAGIAKGRRLLGFITIGLTAQFLSALLLSTLLISTLIISSLRLYP